MQGMTERNPIQLFERLRKTVFPAVEEYWRGDVVIATFLDQHLPYEPKGPGRESCWKAALGALFGPKVVTRIESCHETPWMNRTSMERALKDMGVKYRKVPGALPAEGMALVQWEGVPNTSHYRGNNLRHSHWIAVVGTHVFDVNWPAWIPLKNWEELVVVDAMSMKRATGWSVVTGFEIG
jgi:hypothetical protein